DGHGSHITYDFVSYCENNHIIVYCLPPHSTHLLQPLDIELFALLQSHYSKAVKDYFLATDVDISRDTFYPLYKKARTAAYTSSSIASAFKACGI
ncbi:CENP-B protein, partial [Wilcoxina mikolae CBS 423.85]